MDQSFSAKNLRSIWDLEARRGRDRLHMYPDLRRAYDVARDARQRARAAYRASLNYIGPPELAPDAVAQAARSAADNLLETCIISTSEQLIDDIETDAFEWGLKLGPVIGGTRQVYCIAETPHAFFADRHLQRVVSSALRNRPPGRQAIVAGLIKSLGNNVPKIVARVDVAKFYENVDHRRLSALLDSTSLTPSCKRLIDKLLLEMEALTGNPRGLPAGVGLSAKLAELYIAQADRALRDSVATLYFARYVDDIIIVRGQERAGSISSSAVVAEISAELQDIGLGLNPAKIHHGEVNAQTFSAFKFLGYEITNVDTGAPTVRLTTERSAIIKARVDKTFAAWDRANPANHGRRSLLIDRLRFLTGNTRLSHNKRNALVGIYFSNPHLTDMDSLRELDHFLQDRASQSVLPPELTIKVNSLSFEQGFINRTVHRWTTNRMKRLKGAWIA